MIIYDEYGNEIGDDGLGDYNQFMMPQMPGQNYSTSKWNFGAAQPVGQNVFNQSMTGINNMMKLWSTPQFNLMTDTMIPGANTFDWMGAAGASPYGEGGMGGYGGGYGAGAGGAQSAVSTPYLSGDYSASPDPRFGTIQQAIRDQNQTPEQVMLGLMGTTESDPDTLDQLSRFATEMYKEKNALQAAALAPPQQTAMQEFLAKSGMADPRAVYDENNLPPEMMAGLAAKSGMDRDYENELRTQLEAATTAANPLDDILGKTYASTPFEHGGSDYDDQYSTGGPTGPRNNPNIAERINSGVAGPGEIASSFKNDFMDPIDRAGQGAWDWLTGKDTPASTPQRGQREQQTGQRNFLSPLKNMWNEASRQYRTDPNKRRVGVLRANLENEVALQDSLDQKARQFAAQKAQQQGRSPARDQMNAKLAMMRQLGISI